jgi:hypothetical protein
VEHRNRTDGATCYYRHEGEDVWKGQWEAVLHAMSDNVEGRNDPAYMAGWAPNLGPTCLPVSGHKDERVYYKKKEGGDIQWFDQPDCPGISCDEQAYHKRREGVTYKARIEGRLLESRVRVV